MGKKSNPDAIGAHITWQAGDLKRSRLKIGGGSYLSSHDSREVMGIGPRTKIDRLEIRWPQPSMRVDVLTDLPIDRYITIVEGGRHQTALVLKELSPPQPLRHARNPDLSRQWPSQLRRYICFGRSTARRHRPAD